MCVPLKEERSIQALKARAALLTPQRLGLWGVNTSKRFLSSPNPITAIILDLAGESHSPFQRQDNPHLAASNSSESRKVSILKCKPLQSSCSLDRGYLVMSIQSACHNWGGACTAAKGTQMGRDQAHSWTSYNVQVWPQQRIIQLKMHTVRNSNLNTYEFINSQEATLPRGHWPAPTYLVMTM